jgi:dinuclear metal center YbgI/SA1388 family protein
VARRDDIVRFADELLSAGDYPDSLPVGLQVPGRDEVELVVTGVTASLELFQAAAAAGAGMVLVHHGLFWDWDPRRVGPVEKARLQCLFDNGLSLVAYHLALDAHPEVGNNALLCRTLGLDDLTGFGMHHGRTIGFAGTLPEPLPMARFMARIRDRVNAEALVFDSGPELVRHVAVVSGSAAGDMLEAIETGADCFITGEPKEWVMTHAREAAIHFVAAGHYATETFGVRALGDLLAERFGVEHRFVDVPNPV